MNPSLERVSGKLDLFLTEYGQAQKSGVAGRPEGFSWSKFYARFSDLLQPEVFQELDPRDSSGPPLEKRRRELLRGWLLTHRARMAAASALDEIEGLESSVQDAWALIPREPNRELRHQREKSLGSFYWKHQAPYGRALDAAARAREDLSVNEAPDPVLLDQASALLAQTEDAYRDLLAYALRKTDPQVKALPSGTARMHDLLHAVTAPFLASHFRREDLTFEIERWLSRWGLPSGGRGPIQLDVEDRPGKSARPWTLDIRAPDEVLLSLRLAGGLGEAQVWLGQWGRAQQLAGAPRNGPPELRRLFDEALAHAHGQLFSALSWDEGWLGRILRCPASVAREAARMAAFHALVGLRLSAALVQYRSTPSQGRSAHERADGYRARLRQALFVDAHRGFFLRAALEPQGPAQELEGFSVGCRLRTWFIETFDQDFWRNPAAKDRLREIFGRGGRDDAVPLCKELTGHSPSPEDAARQLVRVMDA